LRLVMSPLSSSLVDDVEAGDEPLSSSLVDDVEAGDEPLSSSLVATLRLVMNTLSYRIWL